MAYIITVAQTTQVQVIYQGTVRSKQLVKNKKYIINQKDNKQIVDLKKLSIVRMQVASAKDESCFENIELA